MKKITFFLAFALVIVLALCAKTSHAQSPCNGCQVKQTTIVKMPTIYQPVEIGQTGTRIVYFRSEPKMTMVPMYPTVYINMVDGNGNIVEVDLPAKMNQPPANWNETFKKKDGVPVKYPLAVSALVTIPAITTPDGKIKAGEPFIEIKL